MTEATIHVLSYLDDLTQIAPHDTTRTALDIAREELTALNLIFNDDKTTIFTNNEQCPPNCGRWWKHSGHEPHGFIAVGFPITKDVDPRNPLYQGQRPQLHTLGQRYRLEHQPSSNVSYVIMHQNGYSRCSTELLSYRTSHPRTYPQCKQQTSPTVSVATGHKQFAQDIDCRVRQAFCTINYVEETFDAKACTFLRHHLCTEAWDCVPRKITGRPKSQIKTGASHFGRPGKLAATFADTWDVLGKYWRRRRRRGGWGGLCGRQAGNHLGVIKPVGRHGGHRGLPACPVSFTGRARQAHFAHGVGKQALQPARAQWQAKPGKPVKPQA
eukprot:gene9140-biopygen6188